jgi:hypothetical protein
MNVLERSRVVLDTPDEHTLAIASFVSLRSFLSRSRPKNRILVDDFDRTRDFRAIADFHIGGLSPIIATNESKLPKPHELRGVDEIAAFYASLAHFSSDKERELAQMSSPRVSWSQFPDAMTASDVRESVQRNIDSASGIVDALRTGGFHLPHIEIITLSSLF